MSHWVMSKFFVSTDISSGVSFDCFPALTAEKKVKIRWSKFINCGEVRWHVWQTEFGLLMSAPSWSSAAVTQTLPFAVEIAMRGFPSCENMFLSRHTHTQSKREWEMQAKGPLGMIGQFDDTASVVCPVCSRWMEPHHTSLGRSCSPSAASASNQHLPSPQHLS